MRFWASSSIGDARCRRALVRLHLVMTAPAWNINVEDRKKEQERAELHRVIWKIANDLRGSVDGWDFKAYVLGMLFYRFISENLTAYLNEAERSAGNEDFDYRYLSNAAAELGREETVKERGFFILPQDLFANVRERASRDENLNETLARVFTNIEASAVGAASEDDIKGLFADLDVNSGKLGPTVAKRNEKLVKLLDAIGSLDFGNGEFNENTIDLFGDAYEYLMQMYASSAGKSGGEYYTPQEVSELLARITVVGKTEVNKVYDPACGSGSLLLKFKKVLPNGVRQGYFGQEINLTTYNLCRINMFLHDVPYEKFDIAHGDTLIDPYHWDDEPFEAIVSNPPYSTRWEGDSNPLLINDERYAPAGVLAPKSKADLAFTMHMLSWLAVNGTAAIVEFPGVLYRGGAEQKIRKYLIDNNYVDTVIQLPPDLFFGVTIATCIIVLRKSKIDNQVLFIDASAEFMRQGNKNKLAAGHQAKILEAFTRREAIDHFAAMVDYETIRDNKYNIAVSSYVAAEDTREAVDIKALNAEIARIVARQTELRTQIDAIVGDLESDDATV
ncbi:type I restriction-modification system subunit M [Nonomuraea sp. 3N208]|uniref:type I restriction-modification system subunit M n=1 Tax=Nonomuraea sp. 3N208 TaxID=3457421 RepID=UPI003FD30B1D